MDRYEEAIEILNKYKQKHVIEFISSDKEKLVNQILSIDFEELKELYDKTFEPIYVDLEEMQPIKGIDIETLPQKEKEEIIKNAEEIIRNNKFAVVTMAGGQGTRLGHEGPKGTYKINLDIGSKYLFETIVDSLKRVNKQYEIVTPWYIMTSKENHKETEEFLKQKDFFGYPESEVYIFEQGKMPVINEKGKVLIGENNLIKEEANGNGGIFNSMLKTGVIENMEKRGVEWIFIGSVDNILLKVVDVLLLGLTIKDKNDIGTRTITKRHPQEKIGVLCKKNNKIKVIEYSEIPNDIASITDEKGELVFADSHIMCNLFSINAIKRASTKELNYHIAFKKVKYLNKNKKLVKPSKENAYKFEKFIFDSFSLFENISILKGKRENDFAPIKNAEGEDSPETAKKLYENYWKNK